jgi:uncharacterized protein YoxC
MSSDQSANKRSIEDVTISPDNSPNQLCKTPKMDSNLQKKLDAILAAIDNLTAQYSETRRDIEEIKRSVSDLQTSVHTTNNTLSERIDENRTQIQLFSTTTNAIRQDVLRLKFAKEVVVSNIPLTHDEDLVKVYNGICKAIGYGDSIPYANIRRFKRKSDKSDQPTDNSPPIFIDFAFLADKHMFLARYFKLKNLNLTALGYTNATRIYINDRLTRQDLDCQKAAMTLKKDGKLNHVSTFRGKVYVKQHQNSDDLEISDKQQLDVFK